MQCRLCGLMWRIPSSLPIIGPEENMNHHFRPHWRALFLLPLPNADRAILSSVHNCQYVHNRQYLSSFLWTWMHIFLIPLLGGLLLNQTSKICEGSTNYASLLLSFVSWYLQHTSVQEADPLLRYNKPNRTCAVSHRGEHKSRGSIRVFWPCLSLW